MEFKLVDSCDTFQLIHIPQLIVTEIKPVNGRDMFEVIHILQFIASERKISDFCDTSYSF